jgi:hypothetical protein
MANLWIYPGPDHDESLRAFDADQCHRRCRMTQVLPCPV